MPIGSSRTTIPRHSALLVTFTLAWAGMTMFVVSPLVAPFLLAGCLLVASFWMFYDRTPLVMPSRITVVAVAILLWWFAVTALWSADKRSATFAVFLFTTSAVAALMAGAMLKRMRGDARHVVALAFTFAIGFAMWLSLEEIASGMFLRRLINSSVPLTRPHSIHVRMEDGWIAAMQPYVSNKNIVAVVLMTWPMLLLSSVLVRTNGWRMVRAVTVVAAVLAVTLSEHETSKIALALSALIFIVCLKARVAAFAFIAIGWFAATLMVMPVTLAAYKAGLFRTDFLQFSARHRLVIWGSTSERVLEAPLVGRGLASTRVLDEMAAPTDRRMVDQGLIEGTNVHAHNIFLQTWYETGMIGASLMFLAGLPVLNWLRTRSDATAAYLFAAFSSALTVASLSWSLVASWYIATFGLIAVWCQFADLFVGDTKEGLARLRMPSDRQV